MRQVALNSFWLASAAFIAAVGCKVGNPLDRTVKVTQGPSVGDYELPVPQTRLSGNVASSRDREPSGLTQSRKAPAPENVRRPTSLASKSVADENPGGMTKTESTPRAAKLPAEYAELLDAFRDSPPQVQQQALRQLLAVSGQTAPKTASPRSIYESLRSSIDNLPTLPDDVPDAVKLPTRLAAAANENKDVVNAAYEITTTVATDSATPDETPPVQLAGAQLTLDRVALQPPPTETVVASGPENKLDITSLSDAEVFAVLQRRLAVTKPGESEADRYRRQIITRHLMIFAGDPDGAVGKLEGMSTQEQEFLRRELLGLWAIVDPQGHPVAVRRLSAALPEFRQATQQLAASAESLEINSLAFCKEIQSFGQVTRFDSSRFDAGQKVILYCEIDNFVAKSTAAGYETQLQGSYEVFDAKGQKVAGQVLPADKQLCANYLRDYFIAYQMSLPSGLEPGSYRLELTMECLNSQKYGQASLELEITKPSNR